MTKTKAPPRSGKHGGAARTSQPRDVSQHLKRRKGRDLDPASLAAIAAVFIGRDGRGQLYGPENGELRGPRRPVLDILAEAESTPRRAVFVRVRPDLFVIDVDGGAESEVRAFVAQLEAEGLPTLLFASGSQERAGFHVFSVVPRRDERERLAKRAEALTGFDRVPDTIRVPWSPHRTGSRSLLLSPPDPVTALGILAPTTAPPRRYLRRLNPQDYQKPGRKPGRDRSAYTAAWVLQRVVAGWSDHAIRQGLLAPKTPEGQNNPAGEKLRSMRSKETRDRIIERLIRSAHAKRMKCPTRRSRGAVDAELERAEAYLTQRVLADPRTWGRRGGALLHVGALQLLAVARAAGNRKEIHTGCRRLAELLGVSWTRASVVLRRLAALGVIRLVRRNGGRRPSTWEVAGPEETQNNSQPSYGGRAWESCAVLSTAACMADYLAPDVFGRYGLFGRGLGHAAWRVLAAIETTGPASEAALATLLAGPVQTELATLTAHDLVVRDDDGEYRRGPATLADVARFRRTVGMRTWKAALHADERRRHREGLEEVKARRRAA